MSNVKILPDTTLSYFIVYKKTNEIIEFSNEYKCEFILNKKE
jgi:hypothetical protein